MVLKAQAIPPLETIYEESGSFISSSADTEHRVNRDGHINETIRGLISARSIPSVNFQRQRINEHQLKPPIEVRFRDGSKRYIHQSSSSKATAATMIMNRRKILDSSQNNLSSTIQANSNYKQIFSNKIPRRTFQTKVPLVITIITAEDLNQAGITPTISSSSDDSEIQALASTQSKPLIDHMKIMKDIHQETLSTVSSQSSSQTIVNSSVFNPHSPVNQKEHLQQQKQSPMNHLQNSTSSQTSFVPTNQSLSLPTQLSSIPNVKISTSISKVPSINNVSSKNPPMNSNLPNTMPSKQYAIETVNHTNSSNPTLLAGSGSRSAFRPFHKLMPFSEQSAPNTLRFPSNTNQKSNPPQQQQNQVLPFFQIVRKQRPSLASANLSNGSIKAPSTNINSLVTKRPYDTVILRKTVSDAVTSQSKTLNSLIPISSSNKKRESFPSSNTNNTNRNSLTVSNIFNISNDSGQTASFAANPNMKWLNVSSNSIHDIPKLSTKYSSIPIRVTLPVTTPTHNQKLIVKHNVALENRLLNAGLSPETVALYERILNIAEDPQSCI